MNDRKGIPENLVPSEPRQIVHKHDDFMNFMNNIIESLSVDQIHYHPEEIINIINEQCISCGKNTSIILYSEINKHFLTSENSKVCNIEHNVSTLLSFVDNNDNISEECRYIIFNIYDNVKLFYDQLNKFNKIYGDVVKIKDEIKDEHIKPFKKEFLKVKDEIKGMQKEYISILGIFSAVVVTFVSSLLFTNVAIGNIKNVNIFKLILILDALAMFLININYFMFKFIWWLQKRDDDCNFIKIKNVNIVLIVILIIMAFILAFIDIYYIYSCT